MKIKNGDYGWHVVEIIKINQSLAIYQAGRVDRNNIGYKVEEYSFRIFPIILKFTVLDSQLIKELLE